MTRTEYFEDYEIGAQRVTSGRTITETDVVIHAGTRETTSRITSMRNLREPHPLASASRTAL